MIEVLILGSALIVGTLVGRSWAMLALIALPLAYIGAGEDTHGTPQWMWATILMGPFAFLALLVGVVIGKALRRETRHRDHWVKRL